MKKTVRVSLSGFSYNLEEDAYRLLDHYLEEIRVRLGSNADAEETLRDIEERISELLTARMGQRETVPADMVQDIINQIGMPEEVTGNAEYSKDQWETQPPKKRLYRDTENPVIAGVCSGVAAFFGVDPIVIRIIFIALLFARGFGLLLYIILWIVVPRALTPKQKLEMRGQPVTLSNMGKNISEEMSSVKSSVSQKVPRNFFERLG
ncbi:MAG TPA: PspC domain-containing protein, partial [Tenuifilaceae bacterium]|nr:PspC domain-containing protein [Tenuifilaceae bacterium]